MTKTTKPDKKKQKGRNYTKRTPTTKFKKKAMIEALVSTLGNVSAACKKVGIHRDTHYTWIEKDKEYADEVLHIHEYKLDFYEQALHKLAKSGNVTAIIFGLKTQGKERGYVERQEVDHSGSVGINNPEWKSRLTSIHSKMETKKEVSDKKKKPVKKKTVKKVKK